MMRAARKTPKLMGAALRVFKEFGGNYGEFAYAVAAAQRATKIRRLADAPDIARALTTVSGEPFVFDASPVLQHALTGVVVHFMRGDPPPEPVLSEESDEDEESERGQARASEPKQMAQGGLAVLLDEGHADQPGINAAADLDEASE